MLFFSAAVALAFHLSFSCANGPQSQAPSVKQRNLFNASKGSEVAILRGSFLRYYISTLGVPGTKCHIIEKNAAVTIIWRLGGLTDEDG